MWCNSKQNECLCRSSRSKGFYKKFVLRNFPKSTRKHLCQSLFFEKVRRCRSATSWKTRLQCECFLLSISKPVRTPFLQNTTGRLLLIIEVSIVVKGKLGNETVIMIQKLKHANLNQTRKL